MNDDFVSLFTFNRWANARMLDACRKLTPEQYAAEPVPDWTSVRATVGPAPAQPRRSRCHDFFCLSTSARSRSSCTFGSGVSPGPGSSG
jgi:hypothetical protein